MGLLGRDFVGIRQRAVVSMGSVATIVHHLFRVYSSHLRNIPRRHKKFNGCHFTPGLRRCIACWNSCASHRFTWCYISCASHTPNAAMQEQWVKLSMSVVDIIYYYLCRMRDDEFKIAQERAETAASPSFWAPSFFTSEWFDPSASINEKNQCNIASRGG